MHVEWKIVTGNPQVTRKLKEFAKMCCAFNPSPKLVPQTLVMAVTLLVLVNIIMWCMCNSMYIVSLA